MVAARDQHEDAVPLVGDVRLGARDRVAEVLEHGRGLPPDPLDVRRERVAHDLAHPPAVAEDRGPDPGPPAPPAEDLEAVGAERLAGRHRLDLVQLDEGAPHHLLGLPPDRPVPPDVVGGAPHPAAGSVVAVQEPEHRLGRHAELLLRLPPGARRRRTPRPRSPRRRTRRGTPGTRPSCPSGDARTAPRTASSTNTYVHRWISRRSRMTRRGTTPTTRFASSTTSTGSSPGSGRRLPHAPILHRCPDGHSRRAIVFDMDGTLLDSHASVIDAFAATLARLGGPGRSRRGDLRRAGARSGRARSSPHLLGRPAGGRGRRGLPRPAHRARAAGSPSTRGSTRPLDPPDDPAPAVFTNASTRSAGILLRAAGLDRHFATVVTGDEVEHPKPAPDGLVTAGRLLGLEPGEIAYVGDSPNDLGCARARRRARRGRTAWGELFDPLLEADVVLRRPGRDPRARPVGRSRLATRPRSRWSARSRRRPARRGRSARPAAPITTSRFSSSSAVTRSRLRGEDLLDPRLALASARTLPTRFLEPIGPSAIAS